LDEWELGSYVPAKLFAANGNEYVAVLKVGNPSGQGKLMKTNSAEAVLYMEVEGVLSVC